MAKAPTTHVWLLEQGSPDRPERVGGWLSARLLDPGVLPVSWTWLRVVLAWVLTRLRRLQVRRLIVSAGHIFGPVVPRGALWWLPCGAPQGCLAWDPKRCLVWPPHKAAL